jgi:hypothetical protein
VTPAELAYQEWDEKENPEFTLFPSEKRLQRKGYLAGWDAALRAAEEVIQNKWLTPVERIYTLRQNILKAVRALAGESQ